MSWFDHTYHQNILSGGGVKTKLYENAIPLSQCIVFSYSLALWFGIGRLLSQNKHLSTGILGKELLMLTAIARGVAKFGLCYFQFSRYHNNMLMWNL